MKTAYKELMEYLQEDEHVEAIIFGDFGWGGDREPEPHPVPHDKFGKILTMEQAEPYLKDGRWRFYGRYNSPRCYAVRIWTNKRVLWVSEYDGWTCLNSAPLKPIDGYIPDMPGG